MDTLLRAIAISLEVLVLAGLAYAVLNAVRLIAFDLGVRPKYRKMVTVALIVVGFIFVVYFVAHLTSFYPSIQVRLL